MSRTCALLLGTLLFVVAVFETQVHAAPTRQGRLRVEVVDVAGEHAYVSPGADRGLHAGATIRIDGRSYRVVDVTDRYGVVEFDRDPRDSDSGGRATRRGATRRRATRDRATRDRARSTRDRATRDRATRDRATRDRATRDRATRDRATRGSVPLRVGDRGVALVDARKRQDVPERLPPPKDLAHYEDQWPEATTPAASQHPKPIPLGPMQRPQRLRLDVTSMGGLYLPVERTEDTVGFAGVRSRVHAEPFRDVPLALDADAAMELWLGGGLDPAAERSRRRVQVRQLQIAYGQQEQFYAALGRLRYASSTLGQLDGLRVHPPRLGPISFSAFGGFVPNALTGRPALEAARFGGEASYSDPDSSLRPLITLVGHGSLFNGEPDERRLAASFQLQPGKSFVAGSIEVSNFDGDNPWGAPRVDVTAASLDTTLRFGVFRLGARASMRQPERSKWLASLLPAGWLCTLIADSAGGANVCDPSAGRRFFGSLDSGLEFDNAAITVGATTIYVRGVGGLSQLGGFVSLHAIRLFDVARIDLSAMGSNGDVLETWAGSVTLGAAIGGDLLDISARYRPAYSRYAADISYFVEHQVGGSVLLRPYHDLDIQFEALGLFGGYVNALVAQLAVSWHLAL